MMSAAKDFKPTESQKRTIEDADKLAVAAAQRAEHAPSELANRWSQEVQLSAVVQTAGAQRPTLFLDIDDVLALNTHYGGRDAQRAAFVPHQAPADLYMKIFSPAAVDALNDLLREFRPRVVLTTSWLALLQREHFIELFRRTGVSIDDSSFHPQWDAPQNYGTSRLAAIERWLTQSHLGEPIVVLDDHASGEGLVDSLLHEAGRVVLCTVDVGFNGNLLEAARNALRRPFNFEQPWLR
jgi:hypothetical protein